MFMCFNSVPDCELPQADLIRLVSWGETLNLKFNVAKCRAMTLSQSFKHLDFNYKMNALSLVHGYLDSVTSVSIYRRTWVLACLLKIFPVKRLKFSVLFREFLVIINYPAHWNLFIVPSSNSYLNMGLLFGTLTLLLIQWSLSVLRPQCSLSSPRLRPYYPCFKSAQPCGS